MRSKQALRLLAVSAAGLLSMPPTLASATSLPRHGLVSAAVQHVHLGYEIDQCSGQLTVKDRNGHWVTIQRGKETPVNVAPDGDGYWYWKCGGSNERSRGQENYRQRVNHLHIWHSTENRQITWTCYQLV